MPQKTIMITGATSGFGEAIARLFAKQGWKLILTGRRQGRLDDLKTELGAD
ncbi:MAG: NADP-dependent 3-hydroxy acid dehydrogenase YdfG, partial [Methylophagaceae bacterium]